MQLRTLSSMLELGAEQNSTVVFPIPMELLRLFDAYGSPAQSKGHAPDADPGAAVTDDDGGNHS